MSTGNGKVVVNRSMSLDGFIAGPGHAMNWIFDFMAPDAFPEIAAATGAMLVGRRTYEVGNRMAAGKERGSASSGGTYPFSGPVCVLTHAAPDPEVPERARTRTFSPRYKLDILNRYESLNKQGKGALLRREGLYSSLISEWRKQRDKEALEALSLPRGRPPADLLEREVERLRRENQRLKGELAKARKVMRVQG